MYLKPHWSFLVPTLSTHTHSYSCNNILFSIYFFYFNNLTFINCHFVAAIVFRIVPHYITTQGTHNIIRLHRTRPLVRFQSMVCLHLGRVYGNLIGASNKCKIEWVKYAVEYLLSFGLFFFFYFILRSMVTVLFYVASIETKTTATISEANDRTKTAGLEHVGPQCIIAHFTFDNLGLWFPIVILPPFFASFSIHSFIRIFGLFRPIVIVCLICLDRFTF